MLDRRTSLNDNAGVWEPLLDNREVTLRFIVLVEAVYDDEQVSMYHRYIWDDDFQLYEKTEKFTSSYLELFRHVSSFFAVRYT